MESLAGVSLGYKSRYIDISTAELISSKLDLFWAELHFSKFSVCILVSNLQYFLGGTYSHFDI